MVCNRCGDTQLGFVSGAAFICFGNGRHNEDEGRDSARNAADQKAATGNEKERQ